MSDFGAPPVIPTDLQQYNSYVEDPKWQRKFTIIYCSAIGITILYNLPHLIHSIKKRRAFSGVFGVWEELEGKRYEPVPSSCCAPAPSQNVKPTPVSSKRAGEGSWSRKLAGLVTMVLSTVRWTIPGAEVSFGQMLVIAGYLLAVICCIVMKSELVDNPNRGGFLALAQLPPIFLFASKNSLLSILLGPGAGYEKLNYIHRWAGRGLFIAAAVHGSLWIRNHLVYGLPILGQQKETSGVAAFGVLCVLVISSTRVVRRLFYQWFFAVHVLGYVSFFITICYHTPYATPWIFPPLAFYGLDILMRLFKYRIKDATLVPVDQNMTLIHIHDCDGGWEAGQHVRLRVFFSNRVFESHPLTIINAPSSDSSSSRTMILGARVCGDWTKALNSYALSEQERLLPSLSTSTSLEKGGKAGAGGVGVPVQVMIDGPYGGCWIDIAEYESAFLVAGGSGMTFVLGVLDDLVKRCSASNSDDNGGHDTNGKKKKKTMEVKTKRVEVVWCVRSFGCIEWFTPFIEAIALAASSPSCQIDIHFSIYVTCLCNPDAVPDIPNLDVVLLDKERPDVWRLVNEFVGSSPSPSPSPSSPTSDSSSSIEEISLEEGKPSTSKPPRSSSGREGEGGGLAVCASGPESLIRSTQNAVARLGVSSSGRGMGRVGVHTELYAL